MFYETEVYEIEVRYLEAEVIECRAENQLAPRGMTHSTSPPVPSPNLVDQAFQKIWATMLMPPRPLLGFVSSVMSCNHSFAQADMRVNSCLGLANDWCPAIIHWIRMTSA